MSTANLSAYHIVIPARFASERLPGKVLLDLAGQSLFSTSGSGHANHRQNP